MTAGPGTVWSPASLSIQVGDSVTFVNGGGSHSFVRDDTPDSCSLPCTRTFGAATTVRYHCGVHPSMTGTILVGAPVTIAITSPAPGAVVEGIVNITGTISHPTEPITSAEVRWAGQGAKAATIMGSGSSVSFTATLDSRTLNDGGATILARGSIARRTDEAAVGVIVDNPDRIDVKLLSFLARDEATTESSVTFTVQNDANVAAPTFTTRVEYLYQGEWRLVGQQSFTLGADGFATRTIPWEPEGTLLGEFELRAIADVNERVPDVDRSNDLRSDRGSWFVEGVAGLDLTDPV